MSLTIQHLSKSYIRNQVFTDISFELKEETIYGLLGRNGAGKSTLLNAIAHRININQGQIKLDGADLWTSPNAMKEVYLTNDEDWFDTNMKISHILKLYQQFYPGFDQEFADELLVSFQLSPKKRFRSLSTGYRSIAKLIIALCVPAAYIFLDEPVLGLDANHRMLFNRKLLEAYERHPRTFVISTHMIEEIAYLLEHVILLDEGVIKQDLPLEDLLSSGYVVAGPASEIDQFIQDKQILHLEQLGQLKQASIIGARPDQLADNLSLAPLTLQNYFVQYTEREEHAHVK